MNASALIAQLQEMIDLYGDKSVIVDIGDSLATIEEFDYVADEHDAFIIWIEK